MTFAESDVAAIAAAREIHIETRSASGTVHRTIIWIVEHEGTVYVRSVNGPGARWFREASAVSDVALLLKGKRIEARVEAATDAASIAACSSGLEAKYKRSYSLQSMLMPHTLPTTLRVVPA